MHHVSYEKQETTHERGNRTTKSRKNLDTRRKENQQYLAILEADTIKLVEMREKFF